MRTVFSALLIFISTGNICLGQGGPGGVGNAANNKVWLDANRGITIVAGGVNVWADQSGNAFNATANGAAARPVLVAGSVNGYPSLDFDGANDEMWINDNAALDLTQWHFFIVPIVDVAKDYNAWLTKGNDGQENYEMLSYATNNIHTPLYFTDATRTSPSSGNNVVSTANFNIIEYSYSTGAGRDVYQNYGSIYTDNENKTPATNNFSVYIGNEKNIAGRFASGDLAEVIMYNAPLNPAQRIIVNNYLAAKYNLALTANDLYDEDNAANGNFDHNVAGIGQESAGVNNTDAQGSGVVRILNPVGLNDGEYYIWGHNNGVFGSFSTTDVPPGVQGRLLRVWRGSETGAITSFDVRFDLTGLGSVTPSDLRLLVDTDNDGVFADETVGGGGIISGATSIGGNVYQFAGVTAMNNNLRFTISSINLTQTPLPVDLLDFTAILNNLNKVDVDWSTATEKNSDFFDVERSTDAVNFEKLFKVKSKSNNGNSNSVLKYKSVDNDPVDGVSYYRLKHNDKNGSFSFSNIVSVNVIKDKKITFSIYPNPNSGEFIADISGIENNHEVQVSLKDEKGRLVYNSSFFIQDEVSSKLNIVPESKLGNGLYICTLILEGVEYHVKVIVN